MILLVMGVAGCGKTTVGHLLAQRLGCRFLEGDDFHPPANIEKMRRQVPLEDADRWPWLDRMAAEIAKGGDAVLACSALKRAYRDRLRAGAPDLRPVFLQGTAAQIRDRMAARAGHFMPVSLLDSQFATLEPPQADERPITLDIGASPQALLRAIMERLEAAETEGEGKP